MTDEEKDKICCGKCSEYFHHKKDCKREGRLCVLRVSSMDMKLKIVQMRKVEVS